MTHKKRTTNGLVALGAAAVVAVYAAGYVHTAAAAQRFSDESNERRPTAEREASSPPGVVTAGQSSDARMVEKFGNSASGSVAQTSKSPVAAPSVPLSPSNALRSASSAPTSTSNAPTHASPKSDAKSAVVRPLSTAEAVKNAIAAAASKAIVDTATATVAAAVVETTKSTTTPPATTPPATTPPATTPPPTTPPAGAAETTTKPEKALPPAAKWHDGRFVGYGQSRHGDIEATIEIWEGKITYVAISQCLTQYSCSFIEKLPQQVFDRQSPDVDNVSGATQSSNAFYYAIAQALQKAK